MPRQSSVNIAFENLADGYRQTGGTTPRDFTQIGGDVEINASNTAVYTFPPATDTIVLQAYAQTLTNKTIDADLNTITNIGASEVEPGLINDLTVLVTVDKDLDYVMVYDNDAGDLKKALVKNLLDQEGEHAEMYVTDNSTATTISASSTPVKVNGTYNAGLLSSNFSHSSGTLTFTGAVTGKFLVTVSSSVQIAGTDDIIAMHVAKNGTVQSKSRVDRFIGTGGNEVVVSMNLILELTTNDTIEVFVSNETDTGNVTITYLNLSAIELNGTLVGSSSGAGDAYSFITDGSITAGASGSDTIKFRSSDSTIDISVGADDVTHGDNVDITLSSVDWSIVTNAPTTLSGYGITDAYTQTQLQTSGSASVHWNNLTNIPTYDNYGSWSISVDGGTADPISSAEVLNVDPGSGINLSYDPLTNTLTISASGSSYSGWTIAGDTGSESIGSGDTLTIAGGTSTTTTYDSVTNTLTIDVSGAGGFSDFTISDGSTSQVVGDGDTVTFSNGTAIQSAVSATDTVTHNLDITTLTRIPLLEVQLDDDLLVYDTSASEHKIASVSNVRSTMSVNIIAGLGLGGGGQTTGDVTITLSHLGFQDLTNPGADRIAFWDDSLSAFNWLSIGSGLSLIGNTLSTSGGGSMSSFSITDGSTTETINDSDTITYTGSEGVSLEVSATDTVTATLNFLPLTQAAPASLDSFAYYDNDGLDHKKTTVSQLNSVLLHNSLSGYAADEHVPHSSVSINTGTGLTGGGTIVTSRTISLNHLGIQTLNDPGADRIMFWDDSANSTAWLSLGSGLSISGTTLSKTAENWSDTLAEGNRTGSNTPIIDYPQLLRFKMVDNSTNGAYLSTNSSDNFEIGGGGAVTTLDVVGFSIHNFYDSNGFTVCTNSNIASGEYFVLDFDSVAHTGTLSFYDDLINGISLEFNPSSTITLTLPNTKTGTLAYVDEIGGNDINTIVSNPTASQDSYAVTWDNTSGEYTLTDVSTLVTSGANTALSNLTTTAINTDLLPETTNVTDIGSASEVWDNLYVNTINGGSSGVTITTPVNTDVTVPDSGTGVLEVIRDIKHTGRLYDPGTLSTTNHSSASSINVTFETQVHKLSINYSTAPVAYTLTVTGCEPTGIYYLTIDNSSSTQDHTFSCTVNGVTPDTLNATLRVASGNHSSFIIVAISSTQVYIFSQQGV